MTAYPEGYLARELELCYANISMVTDHDVGVEGADPVSHETVHPRLHREQRQAPRAPLRGDPEDRPAARGRLRHGPGWSARVVKRCLQGLNRSGGGQ